MPFTTLESHARDISTPWDIWAWNGSGDGDGSSDGDGHNDACSDGDGPFPAGPRQPKAVPQFAKLVRPATYRVAEPLESSSRSQRTPP